MGEEPPADLRHKDWDAVYRDRGTDGVSWHQPGPEVSLWLFDELGITKEASVVDIGGGASGLVDALLGRGFGDLTVLDISQVALDAVRARIGTAPVSLVRDDLLAWKPRRAFDVWHDRAVFHFLVEAGDRCRYSEVLESALRPEGYVVMATFAPDGPDHCSGLPVVRYSARSLGEALGPGFAQVATTREEHTTPDGVVQAFIWVAFRRRSTLD